MPPAREEQSTESMMFRGVGALTTILLLLCVQLQQVVGRLLQEHVVVPLVGAVRIIVFPQAA